MLNLNTDQQGSSQDSVAYKQYQLRLVDRNISISMMSILLALLFIFHWED
jgi:hypothetical protein